MTEPSKSTFRRFRNGVPLLPHRPDGKTVTMEMIKRIEEEEYAREAMSAMNWAKGLSGGL